MLKAAQCLTVLPGQSIRIETEAGEIVLNVITASRDSLRIELLPNLVESVSIQAAAHVRSKALTRGNRWVHHADNNGGG